MYQKYVISPAVSFLIKQHQWDYISKAIWVIADRTIWCIEAQHNTLHCFT